MSEIPTYFCLPKRCACAYIFDNIKGPSDLFSVHIHCR